MNGIGPTMSLRFTFLLVMATVLSGLATWFGVHKLNDERSRLARFEAMAKMGTRPRSPLMTKGMAFSDTQRHAAVVRFANQLTSAANGHRLLIERLKMAPVKQDRQALLIADISLSGSEADIWRFASLIEKGKPAIRFESWRIARTAKSEASIRIEARALALWAPGK